MNIDDAFPSKYLKASDLPEEGYTAVTIEKIEMEEVGKDKERKPVIYCTELPKPFICNKTNANSIARVTGSRNLDDWRGKMIRLVRAEVDFQGEMVESIRVSIKTPKQGTPNRPDVELDEATGIPF